MLYSWLAVGGPVCAGKTSFCKHLAQTDNRMYVPFSDVLKDLTLQFLALADRPTTLDEMLANKEKYRPFLQELGVILDIDNDPRFIQDALSSWRKQGRPPIVVEAVRTPAQYKTLHDLGFKLVWLDVNVADQDRRARDLGYDLDILHRHLQHPVERHGTFLRNHASLIINTSGIGVDEAVDYLAAA